MDDNGRPNAHDISLWPCTFLKHVKKIMTIYEIYVISY